MSRLLDGLTANFKRAADVLFILNPRGTSIGVMLGILLHGVALVFSPVFQRHRDVLDVAQVSVYHWIAGGIVVLNLPTFLRRRALPFEIEDAFEAIRRSKSELSAVQV